MINEKKDYCIIAITKHGVQLARDLHEKWPEANLFYMSKFEQGDEKERSIGMFSGSVRLQLPTLFESYKGLVLIVSLGAVVRMIAPLLKDKKTDPAIVVIDDKGENVISVLSGHLGGANQLTEKIAKMIHARPIITTASDVGQTIAVDIFGREFGWQYESDEKLTPVSAAVVNEEKVAVVQESGELNWWKYSKPLPSNIKVYDSIKLAKRDNPNAALVITHRLLTDEEKDILDNGILYRPKVIVLGMGCNRGTSADEIDGVIHETLAELQFSLKSVKAICTIDLKKDEQGFLDIINKYGWDFITYTPEELNQVAISDPSDTVYKYTGAYGVSEPAALLYSKTKKLELVKKKSGNVTISVGILANEKGRG
ncbi:cobalamin biosynthesis protein [Schinkia azotoformans]|uniref:Cobalamin (Vitamin B12) biosynthesis protein CbiG n=1 Tax=Schinkia azotoformans LMG 9581 TaxID=1131731 RepID=K6D874_SCHAZ|nr:cobalamin biosynthesis protein [Schinkia azotoformans]EKN64293.1 cobalamin (vitamin B12) biosynthesis protein CbiG [Schinkia azotoformans LMG 9581]MEC1637998.1 cobalamin biosynthesis protein [Schinkia azotoformans]MEC1944895.1 cobalamin biosynthesis protein [Schinkia azotoformans]